MGRGKGWGGEGTVKIVWVCVGRGWGGGVGVANVVLRSYHKLWQFYGGGGRRCLKLQKLCFINLVRKRFLDFNSE